MKKGIFSTSYDTDGLVFLYAFAILFNLAFLCLVYFPLQESPDITSYLGLAQFEFDQNPVRRYRIVIPFLACTINFLFGTVFDWIHPWNFEGDFSMCFSFLVVNVTIMAIAYTLVYSIIRNLSVTFWPAIIGITAVISSRWSAEISGLPLVDSLYFLCLVILLYGIILKKFTFLIIGVWLGPWAKESFVLLLPFILWFSGKYRNKIGFQILASYLVYFSFRFGYDYVTKYSSTQAMLEDFSHIQNISLSLNRIFSFHGLYDFFSVVGFWIIIPLYAVLKKWFRISLQSEIQQILFTYLLIVIIHSVLSSDIGRMLYLAAPVLAIIISFCIQEFLNRKESLPMPA